MFENMTTATAAFVGFLDNDGRIALSGALYDASSQEWQWMQDYRSDPEAYEYHRKRWDDLGRAAEYVSRLIVFERAK